jgi:hypothetical protein
MPENNFMAYRLEPIGWFCGDAGSPAPDSNLTIGYADR